jgi:hypothetical protein
MSERRGGVEYQARSTAAVTDKLKGPIDVFAGLGMEGDVAGAGFGEVGDDAVDRFHHQVHVDGRFDAETAQRFANHRPDGEVGDIMVVHDVEMDDVRAGFQNPRNVVAQAREIR